MHFGAIPNFNSYQMHCHHQTRINKFAAPPEFLRSLQSTAQSLVTPGKGILAADESTGTISKRLSAVTVENTEESRRAYRELLFTAPGVEESLSGVILFDETIRQGVKGESFAQVLTKRGIIPGIKVDKGTSSLPGTVDETTTQGLDDLLDRCKEYYSLGARFAKWRAVLKIGSNEPTQLSIDANAEALARYAAICQQAGLVPIVEPEVLMDGAHSIEECADVTEQVINVVYEKLRLHKVYLEGTLLKPNMVTAGKDYKGAVSASEIAKYTVEVLKRSVPAAVPGIVFLSGGQSEAEATANLLAINKLALNSNVPWRLSFSYGRALQQSVLQTWSGKEENKVKAQQVLLERAQANGSATKGIEAGEKGSKESTFAANYRY